MKKAYDIKIDELKNLYNLLLDYSYDSSILLDLLRLENYIKKIERNFLEENESLYEKMLSDVEYLRFFKPFYPFSAKFASIGIRKKDFAFDEEYTDFILTDEEAFEETVNFFSQQGSFFYSQWLEFKDEACDHLKFIDTSCDTAGETLTLKGINQAFVFSPNHSNITKFIVLVHELEHVIDFFNNPSFLEDVVIGETAALFMELLATDYISKKYSLLDDGKRRKNFLHFIVKSQAIFLKNKITFLKLINKNRYLNEEELFQELKKYKYTEEDITFFLEATMIQDNSYQIPYLIAIELYMIYCKNKEMALIILEDIIMNGNKDNIISLLNNYGIKLNSHILEYEKHVLKK